MIDFYIKQNLDLDNLRSILIDILNLEIDDLCLVDYEEFTPENKVYDFNKFKVICTYQFCKEDVSLLVNIIDGDKLDNDFIIKNLETIAKKDKLDFYIPYGYGIFCSLFIKWKINKKLRNTRGRR